MSSDRIVSGITVKLDGTNYPYWSHIMLALFLLIPMTFATIVRRKDTGNGTAQLDLLGQTIRPNTLVSSPIVVPCILIRNDPMRPMLLKMIVLCLHKWILHLRFRLWLMNACNSYFWLPPLLLLLRWPLPPQPLVLP